MPTTTFAFLPDGLNLLSLFDQAFAQCISLYTPVTVNTSGGTYTIPATSYADILVNGSAPNAIQLPSATLRTNQPQSIVDISGNALTNNITILPHGAETIIGLTEIIIATNDGGVTLWPIPTGGWYMK